jgi:hypothetical protein
MSATVTEAAASVGLADIRDRRSAAEQKIEELEQQQAEAVREAHAASEALTEIERRSLGGEKVAASTRRDAEQRLTAARAHVAEPWAERREAAIRHRRAVDAEHARYVREHLDELLGELEQKGEAVAERMNECAADTVRLFAEREMLAQAIVALVSLVAPVRPGDVAFPRSEQFVDQARRLLQGGGETAAVLRHDPRRPRHGKLAEEES